MKSLKYIALIGLLYAGLTTLARADVIDLGEFDPPNNGDDTELQVFKDAGGDRMPFSVLRVTRPAPPISAGLSPLA